MVPTAILLFVYKSQARSGESSSNEREAGFDLLLMGLLGNVYIMLNPLIQLHSSEHLGDLKWNSMRYPQSVIARNVEQANIDRENATVQEVGAAESTNEICFCYTSRVSTVCTIILSLGGKLHESKMNMKCTQMRWCKGHPLPIVFLPYFLPNLMK